MLAVLNVGRRRFFFPSQQFFQNHLQNFDKTFLVFASGWGNRPKLAIENLYQSCPGDSSDGIKVPVDTSRAGEGYWVKRSWWHWAARLSSTCHRCLCHFGAWSPKMASWCLELRRAATSRNCEAVIALMLEITFIHPVLEEEQGCHKSWYTSTSESKWLGRFAPIGCLAWSHYHWPFSGCRMSS